MWDEREHVSSDATYIVSLPSDPTTREVLVNTKSDPKSRKNPRSYHVTDSVHPNPEEFFTPTGLRSKGVSLKLCQICGKDFTSTRALDMHLLIHQQEKLHTCEVCHREIKQHQLMSHMLTHHRKTYRCTYSGCHKTYNDQKTLQHHCALRHGVHITSPSFGHPPEPVNNHAVPKQQSYTTELPGLFNPPRKPASTHVPNFSSNTEDIHLPQVKPAKRLKTLATASKSYEVEERNMQTSTSVSHTVEENPVVSQVDEVMLVNAQGYKSVSDFPEPPCPRRMSSFQPSDVAAPSSVSFPLKRSATSEAVYSKEYLSIMLKNILKPQNKFKRKHLSPMLNHTPLLHPKPKSGFGSDLPDPVIRTASPLPLPESSKRKYNSKDFDEVLSDGADSLPVLQSSPKRSRTRSPYLVSPSQMAFESFSTSPHKQFFTKESTVRPAGQEQKISNRTYSRRSAVCGTQGPCGSFKEMEEHPLQPCFSTLKDKGQKEASRQKHKDKNSSPLIISVSVPVSPTKALDFKSRPHPGEKSQTPKGLSTRSHRLTPLTISSPLKPYMPSPQRTNDWQTQSSQRRCSIGGHPSQLRSPTIIPDHRSPRFYPPPYTPPPMLSPHRPGAGFYFNTLLQYTSSTYNASLDDVSLTVDNTAVNIKPRINVGSRYQAEIPPLRDTFYKLYEEHPAHLVWSPWKDLTTNRNTQKKVTELLDMCCSSVLTGGGTNIELALHSLHEVQGNIPAALDLLLMREDFRTSGHPLNNYHYTGSDHWTDHEMRLFRKALEDHGKDFYNIHNVLQTKSVAQCVEYYYIMKYLKKFKQRVQAAEEKDCGANLVSRSSQVTQPERKKVNMRKRSTRGSGVCKRCPCDQSQLHLNKDKDWLPSGHRHDQEFISTLK